MRSPTIYFLLFAFLVSSPFLQAQDLSPWSFSTSTDSRSEVKFLEINEGLVLPQGEEVFSLSLPSPEGSLTSVKLKEASVMPAVLAAKYPEIRTYRGITKSGEAVAIMQSPAGIDVYVKGNQGSWQIEPISNQLSRLGSVTALSGDEPAVPLSCGHIPEENNTPIDHQDGHEHSPTRSLTKVQTRKYILALACTGEFGQSRGSGTKADVMAAFNQSLNILNAITSSEIAMEFELHPNNDTLIFTNPSTDPYVNFNQGTALLGENPPIINSRVGINTYDLGHVFTVRCTDVGGVVSGRACNDNGKARGVTCHYTGLTRIIEDVMAHEVAHQFAVSHSWNNCPGNDGQRAGEGAFEPGSGSTIMSYQGACGTANNVSTISSPVYYNIGSLQQFVNFTINGGGASCADFITLDNDFPEINWPYTDGFAIPISTPFVLEATATDPNGDELFYNWEQYDAGETSSNLCEPTRQVPLFRSIPPSTVGNKRYFPDLASVRLGTSDCEEILPDYGRVLTFRMIARDRNIEGGGTSWDQVQFDVEETAGPFAVTSQTTLSTTYIAGSLIDVTWDVAGTNEAPVNCQRVNIRLSMDNGRTFPFMLAENSPNDGSESVTLPVVDGTQARILVEAADNIFYNLSPSRFTIVEPTEPGFTFVPSLTTSFLCLPEVGDIELFTSPLLGYDSTLNIRIANTLPQGVNAQLDRSTLIPGESARLTVDFSLFNQTDSVEIILEASGPNVDTAFRTVLFDVVSNDFSDLALMSPSNSTSGVSGVPTFEFQASTRAQSHRLEVSDDPRFGLGTFVIENPDPSGSQLLTLLDANTVYFWRVLPSNRCGTTFDVPINVFHTFAADCRTFAESESILIPPNVRTTVEATISIPETGQVSDLNVPLVDVTYSDLNDLRIKVKAPSGNETILVSQRCGGTNRLVTGFDDESPIEFSCNPLPNDGVIRKPVTPLAALNGEEIQGDWKLQVEVINPNNTGGEFNQFAIEFCANIVSQPPTLSVDEVLVPTGQFQLIDRLFLNADDPDNGVNDLDFILVTLPKHGRIMRYGTELEIGDKFTMGMAADGGIIYEDLRGTVGKDTLTFVLTDNSGNIIATPEMTFDIDDDYLVSTSQIDKPLGLNIAPNPTTGFAVVRWNQPEITGELIVTDLQGRVITQLPVDVGMEQIALDARSWSKGLYAVSIRSKSGISTKRLVVQ